MEIILGYLLGLGTVVAIARRGDAARNAVAWTARHVGALSGKVASSLAETSRLAREEYARGREEQLGQPPADGLDLAAANGAHRAAKMGDTPMPPSHLNGN